MIAIATKNRVNLAFFFCPPYWCVPGNLLMTSYTGIERVAALEPDRNDVAIGMVVSALSALVNICTVHNHIV